MGCQPDGLLTINCCSRASGYNHAAICVLCESHDGTLYLACTPYVDRAQLHAQRGGHSLDRGEPTWPGRYGRITKDDCSHYARGDSF
jgi:hypothetical protein